MLTRLCVSCGTEIDVRGCRGGSEVSTTAVAGGGAEGEAAALRLESDSLIFGPVEPLGLLKGFGDDWLICNSDGIFVGCPADCKAS